MNPTYYSLLLTTPQNQKIASTSSKTDVCIYLNKRDLNRCGVDWLIGSDSAFLLVIELGISSKVTILSKL